MVSISKKQANHDHRWVEAERFYAPPRKDMPIPDSSRDPWAGYSHERIALGVTTILFECECGVLDHTQFLGQSLDDEAVAP